MKSLLIPLVASLVLASCSITKTENARRSIDETENARRLALAEGYYDLGQFNQAIDVAGTVDPGSVHYRDARRQLAKSKKARKEYERSDEYRRWHGL
jgi:Tfp pilus assembly protein PilF